MTVGIMVGRAAAAGVDRMTVGIMVGRAAAAGVDRMTVGIAVGGATAGVTADVNRRAMGTAADTMAAGMAAAGLATGMAAANVGPFRIATGSITAFGTTSGPRHVK
ncbi:MAG: hypothetical protein HYZ60_03975 [Methylocystis sp.]|nr:hypothetical protein [Methylocystis sp.]